MAEQTKEKRTRPYLRIRTVVRLVILVLIAAGLIFNLGWGSYSSEGIGFIAAICPLGALESIFGSWAFVPRLIIALVAICIIIWLAGRSFCSWMCPVPPLSRFFRTRKQREREAKEQSEAGIVAYDRYCESCKDGDKGCQGGCSHTKTKFDSRTAVLCGTLGSAAIFGFPVFCLICPVGLTCATLVALMRFIGFNEPSWGLLVFPVVVILEMTVLRKWCSKICPISALMSLIGRLNRTFRPKVDTEKCIRSANGDACHACASACPVHIDPHSNLGLVSTTECTRCGHCAEACPTGAITFPFIARRGQNKSKKTAA
ncbi:MAG: 4Fe-4S binding protein [Coriobacteriaceae bacterium]|nr:4Fe-4S binding protein [Coriobacteriaceae bacterium]